MEASSRNKWKLIILWKERQVEILKGPAKQLVGNLKAPKGRALGPCSAASRVSPIKSP